MNGFDCVAATAGDAPVLARLQVAFNREFASPCPDEAQLSARLARQLAGDQCLGVLGFRDGQPAGHGILTLRPSIYFDGPLAVLDELYVIPELRGHGLGGALMGWILAELNRRGAGELHINVDEEDTDTRRFYERLGLRNREPGEASRYLLYLTELPAHR